MKYLQGSFTLPAGSSKITNEMWEKAFGPPRKEKKKPKTKKGK